ncbi:MAG: RIP metalloprotease RseP, partial [Deltaproteobacteria bacterium]|nr:RIP metalloprotease RseP [Deltaproteobacteria bacterium]
MEYLFGIVILLGALIFFHEFGHFIVAKLCGVRVEVFSLGFGTKLIKKKIGQTEYCLSLIPLGGYVKLYGEDPTEPVKTDAKHSFSKQPVSRRIAIAAAGPFFNFLLAVGVFFIMEVGGLEKVVAPTLAHVTPGSQAWELGLRPNDRIIKVNGASQIRRYDGFLAEVAKAHRQNKPVSIIVQRKEETFTTASFVPQT